MGVQYKIKIEGLDRLKSALKESPQKVAAELHNAIAVSVDTIRSNVIKEAPVNKGPGGGNLRQNIRSGMLGALRGSVESRANYSSAVETGTKPHDIVVKNKRVLAGEARRAGGWGGPVSKNGFAIFGKRVHHPGTKANPFFKRGIDRSTDTMGEIFTKAVENVARFISGK